MHRLAILPWVLLAIAASATGLLAQDEPTSIRGTLERNACAGDPFLRARGAIVALEVSPDGRAIAVGTERDVTLLDAATGRPLARLEQECDLWPIGALVAIAFLRDRGTLVGRTDSGWVWEWDPASPESSRAMYAGRGTLRDGAAISSDSSGRREVLDVAARPPLATCWNPDRLGDLVVADPAGRWLAFGGSVGALEIRSPRDRSLIWWSRETRAVALAVSPRGDRLAVATDDAIEIRETAGWTVLRVLRGRSGFLCLAFIEDGTLLVGGGRGVWIVGERDEQLPPPAPGHAGAVVAIRPIPGGDRFVSAGADRTLRIWDRRTAKIHLEPAGHVGPIREIAADPDGTWFATLASDDAIRFWDVRTGRERRSILASGSCVLAVGSLGGEARLVSGGTRGDVRVWDLVSGTQVASLEPDDWNAVVALGVSPDGRSIASLHRTHQACEVRIWEPAAGEPPRVLGEVLDCVEHAPMGWTDGPVVCGSGRGDLRFVSPPRGRMGLYHRGSAYRDVRGMAFGPGSAWAVAIREYGDLDKIDVATGRSIAHTKLFRPYDPSWRMPPGRRIAVRPDGGRIAVLFGTRLWVLDAGAFAFLDAIEIPEGPTCVAYVGDRIAVGCLDSTVRILSPRDPPARSESELDRFLAAGREVRQRYEAMRRDHDELDFRKKRAEKERSAAPSTGDAEALDRFERQAHDLWTRWLPLRQELPRLLDRVFDAYQRALSIAPDDARALAGLAWVELAGDRPEDAGPFLAKAFADDPRLAELFSLRAWQRERTGDSEGSLEDLTACPEELRRAGRTAEVEAAVLLVLGRYREASARYERLVEGGASRFARALEEARLYATEWDVEERIRAEEAERGDLPRVCLVTEAGAVEIELFEDWAPNTVANFIRLAEDGFLDGTLLACPPLERCLEGGLTEVALGDNLRDRRPVADFGIRVEADDRFRRHFPGAVSMAEPWPVTNGSRFQISLEPSPSRDGSHCVFGRVVAGMEALRGLERTTVREARVDSRRAHAYEPVRIR